MKRFFILALSIIICFSTALAFGCNNQNNQCQHEYVDTVIKNATCTEVGEAESVCSKCGYKTYKELAFLGHDYTWLVTKLATCTETGIMTGACTKCGDIKTNIIAKLEHKYTANENVCDACGQDKTKEYVSSSNLGLSLDDIYKKASAYSIDVQNKDEFLKVLATMMINNFYIKNSRVIFEFSYKAGGEISLWYDIEKINYTFAENVDKKVKTINVEPNSTRYTVDLAVTYNDGTKEKLGTFATYDSVYNKFDYSASNLIKSLAVNQNNELCVIFNDYSIINCGKLNENAPADVDSSVLIYVKSPNGDEYYVTGCLDKNLENVVIPKSHRGLPVTTICQNAFRNNTKIKSVEFGENVTIIGESSFEGCTELTTVTLPQSVSAVYYRSFNGCNKLTTVTYKGTQSSKDLIDISNGNTALTSVLWSLEPAI